MNRVFEEDIKEFSKTFALAGDLRDSIFLITGATGLIGSTLIHCLFSLNQNIKIIAPVRNIIKAKEKLGEYRQLQLINCDLETFNYSSIGKVDYVVHCAAPTSSKFFVQHPVETFHSICRISERILDYSKESDIKSMVYLSSLEVYGQILDDSKPITEDVQGYIDPLDVRSSYPMAKRAVENLCCLYCHEYGVPVKIARLTQTTGAGCDNNDNRVIVQFTRLAAKGEDIVLRTTGESARPYCYTTDAVSALLYILLNGNSGQAYNVANEDTYISAKDLAYLVRRTINPSITVQFVISDNYGYAPVTKQRLSSTKLNKIGWKSSFNIKKIILQLSRYLNCDI